MPNDTAPGLIESIYRECHEHLRENHRKRDQLVAFFGVIMAAYLAGYDELGPFLIPASIVLAAFAALGLGAMAHYRRWHWIHLNAAVVYERIWWDGCELNEEAARRHWNAVVQRRLDFRSLVPFFGGLEATMYYALAVITALPVFVIGKKIGSWQIGAVGAVGWVIGAGVLGFWVWRDSHAFDGLAWMFRFLAPENGRNERQQGEGIA